MKIRINTHNAQFPSSYGDWIDLHAAETVHLMPFQDYMISLGVSMELPEGYEAHVVPRSSTFKNYGILLVNGVGIIDHDYCGDNDIWRFHALAIQETTIHEGDRIAQFRIFKNQPEIDFETWDRLPNPDRGGFGSTGR